MKAICTAVPKLHFIVYWHHIYNGYLHKEKHWRPVKNPQKKVSFKMRETNALRTNCVVDWRLSSLFVCLLHMYVCLLYLCVCLFVCLLVFPEEELWQTSVEACHLAFCQNQAFFSPNCRASPSRCASTDIFWSLGPKGWRQILMIGKYQANRKKIDCVCHLTPILWCRNFLFCFPVTFSYTYPCLFTPILGYGNFLFLPSSHLLSHLLVENQNCTAFLETCDPWAFCSP